jgi:hypothetical protein
MMCYVEAGYYHGSVCLPARPPAQRASRLPTCALVALWVGALTVRVLCFLRGRRYAYVYGTMEHEVAGIALWLPPGTDITLMKMVKFGFAKLPMDTGLEQVR